MIRTLVAALLLAAAPAFADIAAGTPRFSWTLPTQDINGNPIPTTGEGRLANLRLYCAANGGVRAEVALVPMADLPPVTSYQTPDTARFAPGTYVCDGIIKNMNSQNAARSNVVTFVVPSPIVAPKPITGLSVQ